jgi:hypothetical protein
MSQQHLKEDTMTIHQEHILMFLQGTAPHPTGYVFDEIINFDYDEFERRHNMIQWLFPTMHASACQSNTPVLEWNTVDALCHCPVIEVNVNRAAHYMIRFYMHRPSLWQRETDHNHLRITRIIEFLSLYGGYPGPLAFYQAIKAQNIAGGSMVGEEALQYWLKAITYGYRMRTTRFDTPSPIEF